MRSFPSVSGPLPASVPPSLRGRILLRPARRQVRRVARKAAEPVHDAAPQRAAARLTAMSAMASTLAHELSQPITASYNYLQACSYMLRQRITGLEDVLAMVEQASDQTRKAGEIIQRMRDFMVSGEIQGEREDLQALVATACAGIDCPGVEQVEIIQSVPAGSFAMVDAIQIGQVLTNLVTNAVQALEGCPVRRVTIACEVQHGMIALRIADTGCGLSDAVFGRLFEPFHTSKAKGTGLGLALSRTIVEAHGGQLWAERPESGGAVFALTLPMPAEA